MLKRRLRIYFLASLAFAGACSSDKPEALPAESALSAVRPAGNTGTGFFVSGGRVFDANGNEFIIRGTNYEVWPDPADQDVAISGMNNARLNAARLNFAAGTQAGTEAFNAATVQQFVSAQIVPIVAVWTPDGSWDPNTITTCSSDPATLSAAVDNWVGPQRAWLVSQERNIILNISNEWGDNDIAWRDAYIDAIKRLRNAGINALIMVDAGGGCGQVAQSIESYGQAISNADPQHNVLFSLHMYAFWRNAGDPSASSWNNAPPEDRQPYDMGRELDRLKATGLPVVVGEYCGWNGSGDGTCGYELRGALGTFESEGVGYLSWEWMNVHADFASVTLNDRYTTSSDLSPWGRTTIEDPTLGSRALAQRASIFGSCTGSACGGAGGVGGAGGAAAAGGATGGTTGGGGGSATTQYRFESGTQNWLTSTRGTSVAQSSALHYEGSFALAVGIQASTAQTLSTQVDDPSTPAGAVVTSHVFCPAGAPVSEITAWVQHGGVANASCTAYQWTGHTASLVPGQWNTISVTVPQCSIGLSHLGVDFDTTRSWTGTCFVDSVGW